MLSFYYASVLQGPGGDGRGDYLMSLPSLQGMALKSVLLSFFFRAAPNLIEKVHLLKTNKSISSVLLSDGRLTLSIFVLQCICTDETQMMASRYPLPGKTVNDKWLLQHRIAFFTLLFLYEIKKHLLFDGGKRT